MAVYADFPYYQDFYCGTVFTDAAAFRTAAARGGGGRGYYDKYLSRPDVHAVKVGVCFAHQLVGELPAEPHDVAMDYIITD